MAAICNLCTKRGGKTYQLAPSESWPAAVVEKLSGPGPTVHFHPECLDLLETGALASITNLLLEATAGHEDLDQ